MTLKAYNKRLKVVQEIAMIDFEEKCVQLKDDKSFKYKEELKNIVILGVVENQDIKAVIDNITCFESDMGASNG